LKVKRKKMPLYGVKIQKPLADFLFAYLYSTLLSSIFSNFEKNPFNLVFLAEGIKASNIIG
jgi:hypothetical protein